MSGLGVMIRILVVSALLTMAIAGTKNSNPTQYSRRGGGVDAGLAVLVFIIILLGYMWGS